MPTRPRNSNSFNVVVNDRAVEVVVQKGVSFPEEGRKLLSELIQHYLVAETAGSRPSEDGGVLRPHGVIVWNGRYLGDEFGSTKVKINCHDEVAQGHHVGKKLARVNVEAKTNDKITYYFCTFEYGLGGKPAQKEAALVRGLFYALVGDAREIDRKDSMLPWLRGIREN